MFLILPQFQEKLYLCDLINIEKKMISRLINQSVAADFFQGKVIAVLGPRQVGKTTLLSQLSIPSTETLWLNCDNIDDSQVLEGQTTTGLQQLVGNKRYVVIDEAQRVRSALFFSVSFGTGKVFQPRVLE